MIVCASCKYSAHLLFKNGAGILKHVIFMCIKIATGLSIGLGCSGM